MQRPPPVHGEVNERDVERRHDPEDGGVARATLGIVDHRPHEQVADVHHEQDGDAREPRVPRPPRAPRRLAPDRAAGDGDPREYHPHLGGGVRDAIGPGGAPPQIGDRRDEDDAERQVRDPDARHVDIHDPLDVALRDLTWRDQQPEQEAERERERGEPPEHGRQHLIPPAPRRTSAVRPRRR